MEPEHSTLTAEERNAAILRRTLAIASWLFALWSALFGMMAVSKKVGGLYDGRLILLHAAAFSAAAVLAWKPRRGYVEAVLLACVGSVYFAVLDYQRGGAEAALIDGAYPALALLLLYNSRPHA